jgi:hypothetical protein
MIRILALDDARLGTAAVVLIATIFVAFPVGPITYSMA